MAAPPLALVTGANRGLGLAVAETLARRGHRVLLAGRQAGALSRESDRLVAAGLDAAPLPLDLCDQASIDGAAAALAAGPAIDVLVQNAGVYGQDGDRFAARRTLATNLIGPIRLATALSPRLASGARVVLVSSGMGALSALPAAWRRQVERARDDTELVAVADQFVATVEAGPEAGSAMLAYRLSKALLNRLSRRLAVDLAPRAILVNAVCPGWVRTEMGGPGATLSIEEGARGIVLATRPRADGPTGQFLKDGRPIDW
jgi:NAD(P)-dependent dehydrogenase (short-subunit alcohol dehydrogenase family)